MKKRNVIIIGFIVILILLIFLLTNCFSFCEKKEDNKQNIQADFPNLLECNIDYSCEDSEKICIIFPENKNPLRLICATQEMIENYQCPEGTEKIIVKSLPPQLQCI